MQEPSGSKIGGPNSTVTIDEMYIGGREAGETRSETVGEMKRAIAREEQQRLKFNECIGDCALIEKPYRINRQQSVIRIAGFSSTYREHRSI